MDWPAVLIKITGFVLLIWTIKSIYTHIQQKRKQQKTDTNEQQSYTEQFLNGILLYLWFALLIVLSTGMIVNN